MAKPFQTHNQQLKTLRNRNILISNGSKAKAILIRENYYQLINGYKHIFLDTGESKKRQDDYYKNGTTFITNLSYLIVSITNHSTIQNICRGYNELIKRNRCSYDTKCTIPKL